MQPNLNTVAADVAGKPVILFYYSVIHLYGQYPEKFNQA